MADQQKKPSPSSSGAPETTVNNFTAAVKGAKDYNTKFMEFAQANTEAAFTFAQKLLAVKSPSDFVELSVEHSRKQIDSLTKQTKELADLAQKVTRQGKS